MTSGVVLTAAHVVKGHEAIWVRFPADPARKVPARLLWTEGDLAALHVDLADEVQPTRYGLVDQRGGKLACQAVGFPWFKLRQHRRDSFHLIGGISPLSNLYTGTLHVTVDDPPPEFAETPWRSMSGAAVFVGDRLVGVITESYAREGARHLTARRADWDLTPEQRRQIGYHRPVSVNPPPGRDLGAYAAQVRDLAPVGGLRDRDRELAELAAFCAGDEAYLRLRGAPWSGKTALTSSFVLDPPPGVRLAAFFAIDRLGRQDSFPQVIGEQLAVIAEEPPGPLHHLLENAAERCLENGERLLLVVDGLDEDPGIAPLLPRNLPGNVRVLVTGRPHPDLPLDLAADHPLRACRVRTLTPTRHAAHLELEARNELSRWLRTHRNDALLGFLAAARGGLTLEDLAELTDLPWYEGEALLESRIFTRTTDYATGAEVYVFAHETLLRMAERELARHLGDYRARIHDWADSYRARGWPQDTPRYLFGSYERLLTGSGDSDRLVAYAVDQARHDRMSGLMSGEAAALREISAAQRVISDRPEPDLRILVRLAVARERVGDATAPPPAELLVLWARLGHAGRAESLARSIPDPHLRADGLAAVVRVLAGAEPARAEALAHTIDQPEQRAWALAAIVRELAVRGEPAETLARTIGEPDRRAWALAAIAKASPSAAPRLLAEAAELTRSIADLSRQARTLAGLVEAAVSAGDVPRAESLADRIPLADRRVWALSAVVKAIADSDPGLARAVLRRAETTAEVLTGGRGQGWALTALAEAVARCGDIPKAAALARSLPSPYERFQALTALAGGLARAGDAKGAEDLASSVPGPLRRAQALATVAEGIAARGDLAWAVDLTEQAEALVRSAPGRSGRALVAVATAFGVCGDPRAGAVARSIDGVHHRVQALIAVGGTALDRGEPERARRLAEEAEAQARSSASAGCRTRTLVALAQAVEDPALAETLARAVPEPAVQARVLVELVKRIAGYDASRAESLARTGLAGAEERERALAALAETLAGRGDVDGAEQLALSLRDTEIRAQALAALAGRVGQLGRAMAVVERIPHADRRAQACVGLVETAAARGSLKRARTLLRKIPAPDQRAQALLAMARTAADQVAGPVRKPAGRTAAGQGVPGPVRKPADRTAAGQGEAGSARDLADEAERLIRRLPAGGRRTKLFVALARVLIRLGHLGRARRLLGDITSAQDRAGVLGDLAAAIALRGEVARAVHLVGEIEATDQRARAYVTLVKALAERGEVAEAAAVARRHIPIADYMARALTALARADPDGTRIVPTVIELAEGRLLDRVTHPDQQLQDLAELVKAISDSRGPHAVGALADKIAGLASAVDEPERRAQILLALAKGVDPGRSRRLLAHVLSGPAWTVALTTLREADPEALIAAVEELGIHPR